MQSGNEQMNYERTPANEDKVRNAIIVIPKKRATTAPPADDRLSSRIMEKEGSFILSLSKILLRNSKENILISKYI